MEEMTMWQKAAYPHQRPETNCKCAKGEFPNISRFFLVLELLVVLRACFQKEQGVICAIDKTTATKQIQKQVNIIAQTLQLSECDAQGLVAHVMDMLEGPPR